MSDIISPENERPEGGRELDRLLKNAVEVIDGLQKALRKAQPKVEAYEELMDSDGTCTLGRAAKIIGWPGGQGEFYDYLIEKKDIYAKVNYDLYPHKREYFPCETARGKGYYKCDAGKVQCGDKKVVTHTTKVTASGLDHLRRLVKKDFDLEDDE